MKMYSEIQKTEMKIRKITMETLYIQREVPQDLYTFNSPPEFLALSDI